MTKPKDMPDPETEAEALARLRAVPTKPPWPRPRSVGHLALREFREELKQAGPSIGRLEAAWPNIVGERLAAVTRPGKIRSGPRGRELTVHCAPAAALLMEHQSEMIRQRVSALAGGDIVRIRVEQGLPKDKPKAAGPKPAERPVSTEELKQLQDDACVIEDPSLRAAIVALGVAMLTRQST